MSASPCINGGAIIWTIFVEHRGRSEFCGVDDYVKYSIKILYRFFRIFCFYAKNGILLVYAI